MMFEETFEDGFSLTELVESARQGDVNGWHGLIAEFTPLVQSVILRHSLQPHDAEDVRQTVWLRLFENLGTVRQPQSLPGWISTISRNECVNVRRRSRHLTFVGEWPFVIEARYSVGLEPGEELEVLERRRALRAGLRELSARQRRLLFLLLKDPPASYEEIGAELDMPVGSIGPTRARAVRRLRQSPALTTLLGV